MSPRVMVSTCGTSILTNESDNERWRLISGLANCQESDLTPEDKQTLERLMQERKQFLDETTDTKRRDRPPSPPLEGCRGAGSFSE